MFTNTIAALVVVLAAQLTPFEQPMIRTLPLQPVYGTFTQKGILPVETQAADEDLAQLFNLLVESSQPEAVLCTGIDVRSAVQSSVASFASRETLLPYDVGTASETMWLAVYLGADGSLPPAYRVQGAIVQGKTIRLAYARDDSAIRTSDLRAYLVWVPVGPMLPGEYTVELFDQGTQAVTLTRTWFVR